MAKARFEIFKGKDEQFYFRLVAANNEPILRSEGYTAKAGCKNGIESVKTNAPLDERYQRKTSANGQFYFSLVAGNGEVIGTSETYTTESARDNGIEAVKRAAAVAEIEDES
jgi:uncharacterized protein YegP (UPF0339 family)